jgi:hypothetical protein
MKLFDENNNIPPLYYGERGTEEYEKFLLLKIKEQDFTYPSTD